MRLASILPHLSHTHPRFPLISAIFSPNLTSSRLRSGEHGSFVDTAYGVHVIDGRGEGEGDVAWEHALVRDESSEQIVELEDQVGVSDTARRGVLPSAAPLSASDLFLDAGTGLAILAVFIVCTRQCCCAGRGSYTRLPPADKAEEAKLLTFSL